MLSIDLGFNNFITFLDNTDLRSFVINGKIIKVDKYFKKKVTGDSVVRWIINRGFVFNPIKINFNKDF